MAGENWIVGRTVRKPFKFSNGDFISLLSRFFSRMTPTTTMERWNFFVQVTEPGQSLSDILCQLEPMDDTIASKPEDILIRWERQTFRRLPKSGAILFSVKTDLVRFIDLNAESLRDFAIETRSWPEEVANYKRRNEWGECALQYCDSMQKNQDKTDNECID